MTLTSLRTDSDQVSDITFRKFQGNGAAGHGQLQTSTPRPNSGSHQQEGNLDEAAVDLHDLPCEKWNFPTRRVWIANTVILICFIVPNMSLGLVCTQFFADRIARDSYNLTFNKTDNAGQCSNSSSADDDFTNHVQREASKVILFGVIAGSIPATFTCLFVGSYSDFLGRKPLMLVSIMGSIFKLTILCLMIKLDFAIYFYYLGSVVDGLCGSHYSIVLASTSVLADITPVANNRAVKFAIVEALLFISGAVSQLAIGYLIKEADFFLPVVAGMCFLCLALVVAIFVLPETMISKHHFQWNIFVHVKKTFGFYILDGSRARRLLFVLGVAVCLIMSLTYTGRQSVETLFAMNKPICWNSIDIGIFNAIRLVMMSVAAVIVLRVRKYGVSLEITGMICTVSATAGFIVEGFANSTEFMYLTCVVGILYVAIFPIPRALLSQITPPSQQGALFSSLSCLDAISSMVSFLLYTVVYNATLDTFRGAVFVFIAAMCLFMLALFWLFRCIKLSHPASCEYTDDTDDKVQVQAPLLDDTSPLLKNKQ